MRFGTGLRGPNLVTLWVSVSSLWTVATYLRIRRIWVPAFGWPSVLGNPLTWVSLFVPPLMFALILLAVKRIAAARHRSGH